MIIGYTTNTSSDNIISKLPNVPNDIAYFDTKLDLMQVDKKYAVVETAFGVDIQLEVCMYMYVCICILILSIYVPHSTNFVRISVQHTYIHTYIPFDSYICVYVG